MKKILFVCSFTICTLLTIKAQVQQGFTGVRSDPSLTDHDDLFGMATSSNDLFGFGVDSALQTNGRYAWIQPVYNFVYPFNNTTAINLALNPVGGNVGVGLNTPASLFHSAGQISTGIPSGGLGGASATTGSLLFYNSNNTNTVSIYSSTTTASYSMKLPLAQGGASEVLTNDGSGNLSWSNPNTGITNMAWLLTGNSGTTASTAAIGSTVNNNFIGTIDQKDFVLATYNLERMRVTSVGNVGIGLTAPITKLEVLPSTTNSSIKTGSLELQSYAVNDGWIGDNIYYNAGYKYRANGYANIIQFGSGNIYFRSDVSGSAGGTATMATKMIILNGGDVGIGTITPSYRLDVSKAGGTAATVDVARIYASAPNQASARLKFGTTANPSTLADITAKTITSTTGILSFSTSDTTRVTILEYGKVGIGTTSPSVLFQVGSSGDGTVAKANAWNTFSDANFKTNVVTIKDALKKVLSLRGVTYNWITSGEPSIGFIAQEVDTILHCIVLTDDSTGFKSLDYSKIVPVIVEGIKQLDSTNKDLVAKDSIKGAKIHELEATDSILKVKLKNQDSVITSLQNQLITNNASLRDQINQLTTTINNCCSISAPLENNPQAKSLHEGGTITQIDVTLNNIQTIVLEQNVPNPFAEQTTINYFLPDNTVKAQMLFYNAEGKLIQSTELIQKGKGQLNVFASDLSSGIYTYTLVVDGKIIQTKKMMKQ